MGDLKIFNVKNNQIQELTPSLVMLENSLQTLIEQNIETFLAIRFLASEYSIQGKQRGRIDTLGIDENYAPVIIEYKRAINENVINQGLFYLDWLLNHKSDFKLLVMERLGNETASKIDWSIPRLVCIASGYTHYDEHAVEQINRNIDLIRYQFYGGEYLLLEMVRGVQGKELPTEPLTLTSSPASRKTITENLDRSSDEIKSLYDALKAFIFGLGSDVQMKSLKYFIAFRRLKNFACVVIQPQANNILVYVKVDPDSLDIDGPYKGIVRDVRGIGHQGTGDLELSIKSHEDLHCIYPLLTLSYERS